jgi:hypothetical protein
MLTQNEMIGVRMALACSFDSAKKSLKTSAADAVVLDPLAFDFCVWEVVQDHHRDLGEKFAQYPRYCEVFRFTTELIETELRHLEILLDEYS